MADDVADHIEYWFSADRTYEKSLYALRNWDHLKMAEQNDRIWIKGLSATDIESAKVLSIPSINRYYLKGSKLIPHGKKLPAMVEPSLLWTPIARALKIHLPKENFNYFGLQQLYTVQLKPSDVERPTDVVIVSLDKLRSYVNSTYNFRLSGLRWTLLNGDKAIIIGRPNLSIPGQDYYMNRSFIVPAGWIFEFENLVETIESSLGEAVEYYYLVSDDGKISKLRRTDFNNLNKGSVQKSKDI